MCAALLAVTSGGAVLGSVVVARHRAQAAVDLAALGAAVRLSNGHATACGTAEQIVRAMGATLADCTVEGLDVSVRAEAVVALAGPLVGPASAAARAGPVDPAG